MDNPDGRLMKAEAQVNFYLKSNDNLHQAC